MGYFKRDRRAGAMHQANSNDPFVRETALQRAQKDHQEEQGAMPGRADSSFIKPNALVMAKLKMGQAGDKYEKEADATADKVVNKTAGGSDAVQAMPEEEQVQQKPLAGSISSVQKKDLEGGPLQKMDEEEAVQSKGEEEETMQKMDEEEAVQSKGEEEEESMQAKEAAGANAGGHRAGGLEGKLNASKGLGHKMNGKTKQEMESGFGTDFSDVNIHTDQRAQEMTEDVGAQAFTHGNDVYFNAGKYDPESTKGKHLLAHELTHTIQQKGITERPVQKASKKLKDHDKGFLNVKNETSGTVYPLSYNAEVDYKKASGGREYFTAQEWPHRNEKSSVKGSGRFVSGGYNGPAKVEFWRSKKLLKFGNGLTVKAYTQSENPVPLGTHDLMLPDYPHDFGAAYLSDSDFSKVWFRIGESSTRYLHIGRVTLGCITVGASETNSPESRKKWTQIYKYLVKCRAGNNKTVGKVHVYK